MPPPNVKCGFRSSRVISTSGSGKARSSEPEVWVNICTVASGELDSAQFEVLDDLTCHPASRGIDAQHFFQSRLRQVRALREDLPLLRVPDEGLDCEAELIAGRVHAAEEHQHQRIAQFLGVELVPQLILK